MTRSIWKGPFVEKHLLSIPPKTGLKITDFGFGNVAFVENAGKLQMKISKKVLVQNTQSMHSNDLGLVNEKNEQSAQIQTNSATAKQEAQLRPQAIWSRRSTILPQWLGLNFQIHNGKKFIPLTVTENMIGHKFGEFASTRTCGLQNKMRKIRGGAPNKKKGRK